MGTHTREKKRAVKFRRRLPGRKMCSKNYTGEGTDTHSKRKVWDMDVEMVDSDGLLKRSCTGEGVGTDVVVDEKVAEVGSPQPRERQ